MGAIPEGYVIDHLNGNTRDNRLVNLDCVPSAVNGRRANNPEAKAQAMRIFLARCHAWGITPFP